MAQHIWVQVRDVFETRLTGLEVTLGATTILPNVSTEQVHEPNPEDLPLYAVYWNSEIILDKTRDDTKRAVNFVVESWYSGVNLTDWLAEMANVAEVAIEIDHTLGGVVTECQYAGAEQATSGQGEKRSGVIRMNFVCTVITAHGNPGLRA